MYYVRKTTHYAFELLNVYVLWFTTKREEYTSEVFNGRDKSFSSYPSKNLLY